MSHTVLVPIADGIEEIEAVSIIDTLRRAGASVTVASVEKKMQITASRGVKLVADKAIGECTGDVYDLIALPGGMPGAEHLRDCKELIQMLKKQRQEKRLYAAICASPVVVLQTHGLLGEKQHATCHPSLAAKLTNSEKANLQVVVDGHCVTSRGPGTALQFALQLIAILYGETKAEEVARPMLVER